MADLEADSAYHGEWSAHTRPDIQSPGEQDIEIEPIADHRVSHVRGVN